MKSKIRFIVFGLIVAGFSGAALADGAAVGTRSVADAEADLMRTYQTPGGPSAGNVHTRTREEAYIDLMRDWNAKPTPDISQTVRAREEAAAYADMMRIWQGPVATFQ